MKKRIICATTLLLFALSPFQLLRAQSLSGRVYHNANIMADKLNEVTSEVDKKMPEAKAKKIAEEEEKKGRKLTEAEKAEIERELQNARKKVEAVQKGMSTEVTIEFKSETDAVLKFDMKVSEEALKAAGVGWAKRKAMKAALALIPTTQKAKYSVQGNLIFIKDDEDADTLRLSPDGKYLYGKFDEKTNYKLTRTK